jgi:ABC-type glutathione transport system ATPase component
VDHGEIVGVVGESGAGKSTLAATLMRVEHLRGARTEGGIELDGCDLMRMRERDLRRVRGRTISMIHQSAATSLNPALSLERQMKEAWYAHSDRPWDHAESRVRELMQAVGLEFDHDFLRRRPGQVSGGQAQRFLICMAALHRPQLVIADEPNSAVDAISRAEILSLLERLNREFGMAVLLISHDLISVAKICSRMYVLHGGAIVEHGTAEQVLSSPKHDFTRALVAAWTELSAPAWSAAPR